MSINKTGFGKSYFGQFSGFGRWDNSFFPGKNSAPDNPLKNFIFEQFKTGFRKIVGESDSSMIFSFLCSPEQRANAKKLREEVAEIKILLARVKKKAQREKRVDIEGWAGERFDEIDAIEKAGG